MAEPAALIDPGSVHALLQAQFARAGLAIDGVCTGLSGYSAQWRQTAALLEDLSSDEADALGSLMPLVRARAGQALIKEGDVGDWMLLLLSGTVDVIKTSDAGVVSRLAVIKQGAAVGEMSMLDSEPRFASCTAIEAVEAGVLGRREIALLIRDHPAVGAKLLVKITQLMAQRLRNTSNHLVRLLQK